MLLARPEVLLLLVCSDAQGSLVAMAEATGLSIINKPDKSSNAFQIGYFVVHNYFCLLTV